MLDPYDIKQNTKKVKCTSVSCIYFLALGVVYLLS